MSFLSFITKIFGNKSQRDLKEIEPVIKKIEALADEMKQLSNDELRARITAVREDIRSAVAPLEEENAQIRVDVEELPFDQRQPLWDKIDKNDK